MRELIYDASLAVIIVTCVTAVAHPRIHTGIFGGLALALVALFTFAGFEYVPTNWHLGQTAAAAAWCCFAGARWFRRQASLRERLRQLCAACPLREE